MKATVRLKVIRKYQKTLFHYVEVDYDPTAENPDWGSEAEAERRYFTGEFDRAIDRGFADVPVDDDDDELDEVVFDSVIEDDD